MGAYVRTCAGSEGFSLRQSLCMRRIYPWCSTISLDETKADVGCVDVWATIHVQAFSVASLDVSPGPPSIDALVFLREALVRCRGQPVLLVNQSPWSVRYPTSRRVGSTMRRGHAQPDRCVVLNHEFLWRVRRPEPSSGTPRYRHPVYRHQFAICYRFAIYRNAVYSSFAGSGIHGSNSKSKV